VPRAPSYEQGRRENYGNAKQLVKTAVLARGRVLFDELIGPLLEIPLAWETDIQEVIRELRDEGVLHVEGRADGERSCKEGMGHTLVRG
jgi:hypothetical protein